MNIGSPYPVSSRGAVGTPGPVGSAGGYAHDPWAAADMDLQGSDHWLLSYVDILTLLLTLLVVLLVLQPEPTAPASAEPLTTPPVATTTLPVTPHLGASSIRPITRRSAPASSAAALEMTLAVSDAVTAMAGLEMPEITEALVLAQRQPHDAPSMTAVAPPRTDTTEQQNPLLERLLAKDQDEQLRITRIPEGVNLEMRDNVLFDPGSASLKAQGKQLLAGLVEILAPGRGRISVEGHTDDRPIANSRFPSNWELSTGRASAVSRFLIEQGLQAARLRAIGYASTRPLASNLTVQGRARNRRVSLIVNLPKAAPEMAP